MKRFGLIGGRLEHSFSPLIHGLLGDYEYGLYPLRPEELASFMKNRGLDGFNVTIPYKMDVVPFCDRLTERARALGSVNTVLRGEDGALLGENTDYYGFEALLGDEDVGGKKALVLGGGGASRTVRAVLRDRGAGEVLTVSRSGPVNYSNVYEHADAELIVNTTPVGMYPDNGASPLEPGRFPACRLVLDVVYNPAKTELLLKAEELGIPCRNGLLMLVAQAKRASELFQGVRIPDSKIGEITRLLDVKTRNVALIGMPGGGKTAVGRRLAELTGREFIDTDELLVRAAGMSIPEIFKDGGEDCFRRLETEVLAAASKESGKIIATGGGVVTREKNRRLLRQNSLVVWIDCDLRRLATEGRPLSQALGVEELYRVRKPLYEAWSDFRFCNEEPEETAKRICEALGL
jgi:shikimate dehydrogenase